MVSGVGPTVHVAALLADRNFDSSRNRWIASASTWVAQVLDNKVAGHGKRGNTLTELDFQACLRTRRHTDDACLSWQFAANSLVGRLIRAMSDSVSIR